MLLGLEAEPKLPPELSPTLYKLILNNNLNPIKVKSSLAHSCKLLHNSREKLT